MTEFVQVPVPVPDDRAWCSSTTACGACRRSHEEADCIYENAAAVREPGPSRFSDESRAAPRVPNAPIQPFLEAAKDYAYPGLCSGLGASTAPETTNPSAIHPLQLDRSPSEPHGEDSMNGIIGDPARTREVYGSSSASSFIQQIQTAINFKFGIAHQITGEQKAIPRSRSPCPQTSLSNCEEPTLFLLPPKGLADGLIGAYWDDNWALYPVINRRKIETIYDSLWTSPTSANYPLIPMSIINICFAIGCHYSNLLSPKDRMGASDDFYGRAKRLYQKTGDIPSYERVTCLLLFAIYLQSTKHVFQCWMTVGKAIRMAQSLGVHLPESTIYLESVRDREYKRRIWHCCVWLDR